MNNKFFLLLALGLTASSAHTAGYTMKHIEAAQKATGVLSAVAVPLTLLTEQKENNAGLVLGYVSQCLARATESEVLLQKLANVALTANANGQAGYSIIKQALRTRKNNQEWLNERKLNRLNDVNNDKQRRLTDLNNDKIDRLQSLESHRAGIEQSLAGWRDTARLSDNNKLRQAEAIQYFEDQINQNNTEILNIEQHFTQREQEICAEFDEEIKETRAGIAREESAVYKKYTEQRNPALLAIASQVSSVILQEVANTVCVRMVGKYENRAIRRVLRGAILAVNGTVIPELMSLAFQGHYFNARNGEVLVGNAYPYQALKNRPGAYLIRLAVTLAKQAAIQAMYEIVGELIMRSADDAGTLEWLSKEKEKAGLTEQPAVVATEEVETAVVVDESSTPVEPTAVDATIGA